MTARETCAKKVKTGKNKGNKCLLTPGHRGNCRSVLPPGTITQALSAATAQLNAQDISLDVTPATMVNKSQSSSQTNTIEATAKNPKPHLGEPETSPYVSDILYYKYPCGCAFRKKREAPPETAYADNYCEAHDIPGQNATTDNPRPHLGEVTRGNGHGTHVLYNYPCGCTFSKPGGAPPTTRMWSYYCEEHWLTETAGDAEAEIPQEHIEVTKKGDYLFRLPSGEHSIKKERFVKLVLKEGTRVVMVNSKPFEAKYGRFKGQLVAYARPFGKMDGWLPQDPNGERHEAGSTGI